MWELNSRDMLFFCIFVTVFFGLCLVYTFEDDFSIAKALILSVVLWLSIVRLLGDFGFGYAQNLAVDLPLYLDSSILYILLTLLLHLIYGWVLGYLGSRWLTKNYESLS